jgi:YHS domain-containing protein
MKRIALISALVFGFAGAAFAGKGEFGDMCTTGLALGKKIATDCSISKEMDGKTYCFGNYEAKTMFEKDPAGTLAKASEFYSKNK